MTRVKIKQPVGRPLNIMVPIRDWAASVGQFILDWMDENDRNASGRTANSITVQITKPNQVSLFASDHIRYTLEGRRGGGRPPVDSIAQWIADKNITFAGDMTVQQLAWAISTNIAKRGTSPDTPVLQSGFFASVVESSRPKYMGEFADILAKETADKMVELFTKRIKN